MKISLKEICGYLRFIFLIFDWTPNKIIFLRWLSIKLFVLKVNEKPYILYKKKLSSKKDDRMKFYPGRAQSRSHTEDSLLHYKRKQHNHKQAPSVVLMFFLAKFFILKLNKRNLRKSVSLHRYECGQSQFCIHGL